jgi:transglutaminase-like putative cysteine protease
VHDASPNGVSRLSLSEFDACREDLREEYFDFLAPTAYVPHLPQLQDLVIEAESASNGTVAGFAEAASDLIHARFQYVKGATHVHSSIEDSLAAGAGVCQDFAHLLLGLVRMRGLPARYVSGYLVPRGTAEAEANLEEVIGGQASHAWAEVSVSGEGWMPLDPTLGGQVGLRHVRVAYGRDYGDVAPLRGVYKGHAGQRLSVDVRVRPALDDEGHEQMQRTAATPQDAPAAERSQQPAQQQ